MKERPPRKMSGTRREPQDTTWVEWNNAASKEAARVVRARRAARKRAAEPRDWRKIRRYVLYVLGATVVALLVYGVMASPLFWVRNIRVAGTNALTRAEIEAVQERLREGVPGRVNVFRAKTDILVESLERLPAVARVEVIRRPPSSLSVRVTPRRAVAVVSAPNGRWEVDASGVPIREGGRNGSLPEVVVPQEVTAFGGQVLSDAGVVGAVETAQRLREGTGVSVRKITVEKNADICLNMNDGTLILMGQFEEMDAKIAQVRRIYAAAPDIGTKTDYIDLRCPQNPVCTPRTIGAATPARDVSASGRP